MKKLSTPLTDVWILEPQCFADTRGWFSETFRSDWFEQHVSPVRFVQDNHSASAAGVLRGLHYQLPYPQGKLVRVVSGSVFDVAVDLRRASPTFGRWFGVELSADNRRQLWLPPGFAHGFYAAAAAEVVYKCTAAYRPEAEHTIAWNDADLAVCWHGLRGQPKLSPKDAAGLPFTQARVFETAADFLAD